MCKVVINKINIVELFYGNIHSHIIMFNNAQVILNLLYELLDY